MQYWMDLDGYIGELYLFDKGFPAAVPFNLEYTQCMQIYRQNKTG